MNKITHQLIALELARLTSQEGKLCFLRRAYSIDEDCRAYCFNSDDHEIYFLLAESDLEKSLDEISAILGPMATQWLNRQGETKKTPSKIPLHCPAVLIYPK